MTAVEWLIEQLYSHSGHIDVLDVAELNGYFDQAKQMHEKQVVDAYKHGQNNGYNYRSNGTNYITGEEYYEQTYKTQAQ